MWVALFRFCHIIHIQKYTDSLCTPTPISISLSISCIHKHHPSILLSNIKKVSFLEQIFNNSRNQWIMRSLFFFCLSLQGQSGKEISAPHKRFRDDTLNKLPPPPTPLLDLYFHVCLRIVFGISQHGRGSPGWMRRFLFNPRQNEKRKGKHSWVSLTNGEVIWLFSCWTRPKPLASEGHKGQQSGESVQARCRD